MLYRCIFILLILLGFTQTNLEAGRGQYGFSQSEEVRNERAKPIPLLRRSLVSAPSVCRTEDFSHSCKTDQRCKERKEKCGDSISSQFNDELISVTHQFSQISIGEGKYSGNRGFDDIRDTEKLGRPYTFVTENKADSAKLNRKNNQMSYRWVEDVEGKLVRSKKVSEQVDTIRRSNGQEGRIIRSLSHVSLPSAAGPFVQDYGLILSDDLTYRQSEVQSYCVTVHPQVKEEAKRHSPYQTPKHRQNLALLENECSKLSTRTYTDETSDFSDSSDENSDTSRTSYESEEEAFGVCYGDDYLYDREKLHLFISFLYKKYHYTDLEKAVSKSSKVPARVISGLAKDKAFNYTKKYEDLWKDLTSIYSDEYEKWLKNYKK